MGIGDIIAFKSPRNPDETIVHREVSKELHDELGYFQTKGDANYGPSMWSGKGTLNGMISEEILIGRII